MDIIQETREKIVNTINDSKLPPAVIKLILENIAQQVIIAELKMVKETQNEEKIE